MSTVEKRKTLIDKERIVKAMQGLPDDLEGQELMDKAKYTLYVIEKVNASYTDPRPAIPHEELLERIEERRASR